MTKKTNTREEIMGIQLRTTTSHPEWGEIVVRVKDVEALIEKEKKEARRELYEAFDAKYKDFELTRALGGVLQELEKEE